jgi:hypothetical protein
MLSIDRQTDRFNFLRDGFVVLRGFAAEQEVATLRRAVASREPSPGDSACVRPHNTLLPLRWSDRIVELLLTSARRVQTLRETLDADDLRWISGYISIKDADSPALWWHQDWWCWDHAVSYRPAAAQVATLCYLTDTDTQNGALRILAGSHHRSAPIHAVLPEAHGHAAAGLEPEHVAMSDLPDQVTLCLSAGDAVVLDYRLLHGTHGNATDIRRDCVVLNFAPSWRRLPGDIRAHLISHPALPSATEVSKGAQIEALLPSFDGARETLPLNRNAPSNFRVGA